MFSSCAALPDVVSVSVRYSAHDSRLTTGIKNYAWP